MSAHAKRQRYIPHLRISDDHRDNLVAQVVDPGTGVALNEARLAYADNGYKAKTTDHCLNPPFEREFSTPPEMPENVKIDILHRDAIYIIRFTENGRTLDEQMVEARVLGLTSA